MLGICFSRNVLTDSADGLHHFEEIQGEAQIGHGE